MRPAYAKLEFIEIPRASKIAYHIKADAIGGYFYKHAPSARIPSKRKQAEGSKSTAWGWRNQWRFAHTHMMCPNIVTDCPDLGMGGGSSVIPHTPPLTAESAPTPRSPARRDSQPNREATRRGMGRRADPEATPRLRAHHVLRAALLTTRRSACASPASPPLSPSPSAASTQ